MTKDQEAILLQLVDNLSILTEEIRTARKDMSNHDTYQLYTNKTLLELLQVNTTTLRKYRDEGMIGFSKIGDKYYYTAADVDKFLKSRHYEPFAIN